MKKLFTLLVLVSAFNINSNADDVVWKWGENESEAHGQWNYMVRLVDQDKFVEAKTPLFWLLKNTPDLHVGLYINASKVYEGCEELAKGAEQVRTMQDSALFIYDTRIKLFGDEASVLNRKGKVAWKYLHKREGQIPELYALYKKIYDMNGPSTYTSNVTTYFTASCAMYSGGKLSQTEILDLHSALYADLDKREIKYASNDRKLKQVVSCRESLDNIVGYYKLMDCDYIQNTYATKWKEDGSLKLAERINSMIITGGCKSSDLFFETSDKIIEEGNPSFALLKLVGNAHLNKQELDQAYDYFTKAIELSDDSTKSAQLHFQKAQIKQRQGNYAEARVDAYRSLKADPTQVKAYELIGNMYMDSYQKCGSNELEERTVFIAAYNMYQKAGNSSKMAAAKAQFPSIDEIFLRNHQEGDIVNTGCWIGEQVALTRR